VSAVKSREGAHFSAEFAPESNGARKRKRAELPSLYAAAMIARIWRGYTTHANAEAYAAALQAEILPGIMKVPGYRGSYLLKRLYGEEVEFVTVMLWESLESLSAFAGPDYEKAIVPVERRKFLSKYEERSAHYEILMQPAAADAPSGA